MSETNTARTHWSPPVTVHATAAPSSNGDAGGGASPVLYDFSQLHVTHFDFEDLKPIEIPVKYRGQKYVLREAGAGAVAAYDGIRMASVRMDDGKMIGLGERGSEADLVALSLCLHPADDSGNIRYGSGPKPVPLTVPFEELRVWPDRVTDPLIKELKKISPGLAGGQDDTEESLAAEQRTLDKRKEKLASSSAKVKAGDQVSGKVS